MRSRWLMAEAWWAAQFPAPSFSEIALWSSTALPGTLLAHLDRRVRRAGYAVAAGLNSDDPFAGFVRIPWFIREWASFVFGLAILPLILALLLILMIAGLLPAPFNRLAGSLQRVLAATVGDSYAFKQNALREAAIRRCVLERLEWLGQRCRRVVVIAHSQGAAIAHQVLREPLTAPCDVFISCGSGLAKLSEIQRDEKEFRRARPRLWLALSGAVLTSASLFALVLHRWQPVNLGDIDIVGGVIALFILYVFALAVVLELALDTFKTAPAAVVQNSGAVRVKAYAAVALTLPCAIAAASWYTGLAHQALDIAAVSLGMTAGLALLHGGYRAWQKALGRSQEAQEQWQREQNDYRTYYELANRQRMRWIDIFTRHDPVPNGPLMTEFRPVVDGVREAVESREVFNLGSALLDHTTYFSVKDDFLQRVAGILLAEAGIAVRRVNGVRAAERRGWRVAVFAWASRVNLMAALIIGFGMAGRFASPELVSSDAVPDWFDRTWSVFQTGVGNPWITAAVVWVLATAATSVAWIWWNSYEFERFKADEDFALSPAPAIATAALPAAFVGVGVGWTFGWLRAGAILLVLLTILAVIFISKRAQAAIVRRSRSGTWKMLRSLDQEALRLRLAARLQHRDWQAAFELARSLLWMGDKTGAAALRQALKHGSANAARELGWHYESRAREAKTPLRKNRYLGAALAAFKRGAALGDPWAARSAGYRFYERFRATNDPNDLNDARALFIKAIELGDAYSCHMPFIMPHDGAEAEARRYLELGVERGDMLSAKWLAEEFKVESKRELANGGPNAAALRERSARLFRKAFDLGQVDAAAEAGDLFIEVGEIETARRAYTLGARLRSALAARRLGRLEEEYEQDRDAAIDAYKWALQLDPDRKTSALFRLGRVLESAGRPQAARARYAAALEARDDKQDAARAGVALFELAQRDGDLETAKKTLKSASELQPSVAGDRYVGLITQTKDYDAIMAIPEDWGDVISASSSAAMAELLVYRSPDRALFWTRAALRRDWAHELEPKRVAGLLKGIGSVKVAELFPAVCDRGETYVENIAKALEVDGWPDTATKLRDACKAARAPVNGGSDPG
jgi:tetratricopeptide (TPR) repeat protein